MSGSAHHLLTIDPDGVLRCIYADDLLPVLQLGAAEVKRASHVEPGSGGWWADLSPVDGPLLGPFALRSAALDAEVAWLESNVL